MWTHARLLKGLVSLMGVAMWLLPQSSPAQGNGAAPRREASTLSEQLPGYWVSLITQNWRLRMVTPAKGDYIGIPLTAAAQKIADAWDPAKDEAAGQQCRAYGAAGIMMRPERLHLVWQDEATLRIEIDNGTQTRLIHVGSGVVPADFQPDWQGYSAAKWVARREYGNIAPEARYLEVTTTHMLPGYLRQNGVPYSANAVLHEDYDLIRATGHGDLLVVTTTVTDPLYLDYPLVLSAIFQRQVNGEGWDPTPCSATW